MVFQPSSLILLFIVSYSENQRHEFRGRLHRKKFGLEFRDMNLIFYKWVYILGGLSCTHHQTYFIQGLTERDFIIPFYCLNFFIVIYI